jgi:hypothetical protein
VPAAAGPPLLKLPALPDVYRQGHRQLESEKLKKEKSLENERSLVLPPTMSWLETLRIQGSLMTSVTSETHKLRLAQLGDKA